MARRSSLLVALAVASLFLGLAAGLSATSLVSEVEPLRGSAASVTGGSSNAFAASVTSSADDEQAEPATIVARSLEDYPSDDVSEASVGQADTEGLPAKKEVTGQVASTDKEEGLAVEEAPHFEGFTAQGEAETKPETSSNEADEALPVIRLGCGGIIRVHMFEPNVFGGLMLRGRGNIVFIRAFPRMALSRDESQPDFDPTSSGPRMQEGAAGGSASSVAFGDAMRPRPLPFSEDVSAEGVAHSMESLFTMAHPLSLFRESMGELDQWHTARMRALAALHGEMIHHVLESSFEEPTAVSSSAAGAAGAAAGEANVGQPQLQRELVAVPDLDASVLGDMGPIEWNATAVSGLVLLALSLSLLLTMLLMGLSSLIYDTPEVEEEEDEKAAVRKEARVPLLKFLQVEEEPDEKAAAVNPVCKYEPPQK